jgi:hypothetical protein
MAANNTVPGAVSFPYPTLTNISVEWQITGDDNLNAQVTVRYRITGTSEWLTGMPLRRIPAGSNVSFSWTNKFAGSIFDVEPGMTYEVELTLTDPDGGSTTTTGQVTTRAVPAPMAGAPIKNATPATMSSILSGAVPGDIIELGAGTYSAFTVTKNGLAGQPIVIRDSDGNAIINGPGGTGGNAIDLTNRSHIHLDGLTIRNGRIKMNVGVSIAIMRCWIEATGDGIVGYKGSGSSRPENAYIADNTILGPHQWVASQLGASGADLGEGVELTGPGHVIINNYIKGFRDNISLMEGSVAAVNQFSIDILNNDLYVATDDAIEADYGMGNVRVMRNRITNCFGGISSQPSLGGPTYFIRNVMYNIITNPFKLHNGTVGDVGLHNTVVKNGDAFAVYTGAVISRSFFRNNLFIGGPGGVYGGASNGTGLVAYLPTANTTCSFDFDAYGSTTGTFTGQIGANTFDSLATMRSNTTEQNAVQVDLSVFSATVSYPGDPLASELAPADLWIGAGSVAENAGQAIANVNDGYAGSAPDIGAYEVGAAVPVYGPRFVPANLPPTIITAASATPNPVTGTTTSLSVLGDDDGGEPNLNYTWATTGTPPAAVTFSPNNNNTAKNTTATFTKVGVYNLQVTISDLGGRSVTSAVSVTVNQTLTSILVTPATVTLPLFGTQQFTATARDQFGGALTPAPTMTWSVTSGPGNVSPTGLYMAAEIPGTATVEAASGGVSGTATANVVATKFFVVDNNADKAFQYQASGAFTTSNALGTGNANPRGVAANPDGSTLWVLDNDKSIYVYNSAMTLLGSWTASDLKAPTGIAVAGSDIWISDSTTDRAYLYAGAASLTSGSVTATRSFVLGAGNTNPQDIATDGTTVWVVHSGSPDRIFVYRASDGAALGNWTIDPANATPTGLTLDLTGASNSLWTVDSGTDRVYEYANARSILSGAQTASLSFALNTAGGNTSAQGIADPRQGASSLVTNQSTPHSATVGVGWSVLGFRRYWNCWGSY